MAGAIAVLVRNTLKSEFRRINPENSTNRFARHGAAGAWTFLRKISLKRQRRAWKTWAWRFDWDTVPIRLMRDGVIVAGERISSQDRDLDSRRGAIPRRQVAKCRDRSRRASSCPTRHLGTRVSGSLCGRRYCFARSGWQAATRRRTSSDSTRTLCGKPDSQGDLGQIEAWAVSLLRQGQHGSSRQGLRRSQSGKVHLSGFLAWLAWAAVHLQFLAQSNLRVSVFLQWVWTYMTGQRGSRLIVNHHGAEPRKQVPKEAQLELASSSK